MDKIDVVQVIGRFGRYHGIILLLACLRAFPVAWTNMMSPLMAADVPHWCAPPNATIPSDWWSQNGVPFEDNKPAECRMYSWVADPNAKFGLRIDPNQTIRCTHGWQYDREGYGLTATEEWNLVCEAAWKRSLMQSLIMAGSFVGVIICGHTSDKLGRKSTFFGGLVVLMAAGISATFMQSFILFNALRLVLSAAGAGMTTALVTKFMEILPKKDRIYMNVGFGMGYAVPVLFIPLLSYYLRNFRYMQLAIGVSGMILVPFYWLIHESPKWLLAKHRLDDTEAVILRVLRTNRRQIPDMSLIMPKLAASAETEAAARSKNLGFVDVLRVPVLRRSACLLGVMWFTGSTAGYYLALNAHRLPGNPHVNFAISTLAEFPAALIGMYLIRRCRRRQSQIVTMALAVALYAGLLPLDDDRHQHVKVWGTMLVRMFLAIFGYIAWCAVHEVYPTPVRGVGLSLAMMCSRFGAAFAAFLKDIGDSTHVFVPYIVFLAFCCTVIACTYLMPETLNIRLPDTIDDLKDLYGTTGRRVDELALRRNDNYNGERRL